tara:strand:+ start:516 stop:824 length:309 start_codon:yes stop_codon:yes gene_type:complete
MQIGIPQLKHSLFLEPPFVDQEAVHHTGAVVIALCFTSFASSLNNAMRDDSTVGFGDPGFLELAGNTFFDQISQAQSDLCNFGCGNGRGNCIFVVAWENCIA